MPADHSDRPSSQLVLQRTAAIYSMFGPCRSESFNKCYNVHFPASREKVSID